MCTKSPISILQEKCIRSCVTPEYRLIHNGAGTHEPLFKYQVFVGEQTAVGSGRTKKEAKHEAAHNLLQILTEEEPTAETAESEFNMEFMFGAFQKENSVGMLQNFCVENGILPPEYIPVGEEGPPHMKQFTIMCRVSMLEEMATARTKKQAKQIVAHKMLQKVKPSLQSITKMPEINTEETLIKEVKENKTEYTVGKYREVKKLREPNILLGEKISDFYLLLTHFKSDLLEKLKMDDPVLKQEISDNPVDVLKRLTEELKLDAEFVEVVSRKMTDYTVLLTISTKPESALFGMGASVRSAYSMAASNALKHLKIMTV